MARVVTLLVLFLVASSLAGCLGADDAPAAAGDDAEGAPGDGNAEPTVDPNDPHAHHRAGTSPDGAILVADTTWRSMVPATLAAFDTRIVVSEFDVPTGLASLELQVERRHDGPEIIAPAAYVYHGDDAVADEEFPSDAPSPTGGTGAVTLQIDDPAAGKWRVEYHIDTVDRQNEHEVTVLGLGYPA